MDALWIIFFIAINIAAYLLVIKGILTTKRLFRRVDELEQKMKQIESERSS